MIFGIIIVCSPICALLITKYREYTDRRDRKIKWKTFKSMYAVRPEGWNIDYARKNVISYETIGFKKFYFRFGFFDYFIHFRPYKRRMHTLSAKQRDIETMKELLGYWQSDIDRFYEENERKTKEEINKILSGSDK